MFTFQSFPPSRASFTKKNKKTTHRRILPGSHPDVWRAGVDITTAQLLLLSPAATPFTYNRPVTTSLLKIRTPQTS